MSKDFVLSLSVSDIRFDPEDDLTKGLNPADLSYFLFVNSKLEGIITPASGISSRDILIKGVVLNSSSSLVRIIAKDTSAETSAGKMVVSDKQGVHVGTISFPIEYLNKMVAYDLG